MNTEAQALLDQLNKPNTTYNKPHNHKQEKAELAPCVPLSVFEHNNQVWIELLDKQGTMFQVNMEHTAFEALAYAMAEYFLGKEEERQKRVEVDFYSEPHTLH